MKLYTKKGDDGETSILGSEKISKDSVRVHAYGTIDELNSILGVTSHYVGEEIKSEITNLQSLLFEIGTELASETPRNLISSDDVQYLEKLIDYTTAGTPELKSFILPCGTKGSSWIHLARTVARRAERQIVALSHGAKLNPYVIPWINRLSDLFFAWARFENHINNVTDKIWKSRG